MTKHGLLAALLMAVAAPVAAQQSKAHEAPDPQDAKLCPDPAFPCQRNVSATLKLRDGTTYENTFPSFTPTVKGEVIAVVVGQTVYVEAELVDDKVHLLRAVDSNRAPEKTIVAKLEQSENGMMLHTSNPFDKTIKFDMGIAPIEDPKQGVYKTSSCPLGPKMSTFEMWQEPILVVAIGRGRVIPDSNTMVCE